MKNTVSIDERSPTAWDCTAYHEAGHAVMLYQLHKTVPPITMECDEKDSAAAGRNARWRGHAGPDRSQLTAEEVIKVAWAGPLAEMKFRGYFALSEVIRTDPFLVLSQVEFADDLFSKEVEPAIEDLVRQSNEGANARTEQPFTFPAALVRSQFSVELPIFHGQRDCEIAMEAARKEPATDGTVREDASVRDVLLTGMLEARRELDTPKTWEKVMFLARKLLETKPKTAARVELSAEQVDKAIKNANPFFRVSRGGDSHS